MIEAKLNNGDLVSIKSKSNNKFVCASVDTLVASSEKVSLNADSCEIFKLTLNEQDNTVSFNSITNFKYVSVGKKSLKLGANKNEKTSETDKFFVIQNKDGTCSLKSKFNNRFVCSENNGKSGLVADRLVK